MEKQLIKRYSVSFKRHVVEEYESGHSMHVLTRRYGVSHTSLKKWIKQYARAGLRHQIMHIQKPEEQDRVRELEARVAALEKALAQSQLDKLMLETIIEVAEEEEGIVFKKNIARKSSIAFTKKKGAR
ncbi:MAG: transposase [Rhodothermaceae bacterium]|nr:transposase [Rhodothermaceae bacterium]